MLDAGGFVAGLEYATGVEATVLGKPSPSYFAAALDALDAEPELTWLVTDDVEADVRGARLFGMRTAVVRTGKFRPETLETTDASPDIIVSSLAQFPALLEQDLSGGLAR
jgi:ribonucleotide monophosphatase NagD (HAD superfamily)